ncbi:protein of unknown function [Pseudodesulfovibrio profundus]|uniref:Uncharacterized protein n=1 Tax=Pseudodesulfovibrio profundus TaxID=57320 RepID=A0A2C8F5Q2_9BACT|nr:protein of unknown function [Pseudodesulfovibrio profundus]
MPLRSKVERMIACYSCKSGYSKIIKYNLKLYLKNMLRTTQRTNYAYGMV